MRSPDNDDLRLIEASEWARQRWGWLEGVRRDGSLNDNAKMVAHTLVLDFCNTETMRCDPSYKQISDLKGGSPDTAKRGVQALEEAGWITRLPGAGRGNYTVYGFLTRAKILAITKRAPPHGTIQKMPPLMALKSRVLRPRQIPWFRTALAVLLHLGVVVGRAPSMIYSRG